MQHLRSASNQCCYASSRRSQFRIAAPNWGTTTSLKPGRVNIIRLDSHLAAASLKCPVTRRVPIMAQSGHGKLAPWRGHCCSHDIDAPAERSGISTLSFFARMVNGEALSKAEAGYR